MYYTTTELANILGITRQQVRNWIVIGITDKKTGEKIKLKTSYGRKCISESDVTLFLDRLYLNSVFCNWGNRPMR